MNPQGVLRLISCLLLLIPIPLVGTSCFYSDVPGFSVSVVPVAVAFVGVPFTPIPPLSSDGSCGWFVSDTLLLHCPTLPLNDPWLYFYLS